MALSAATARDPSAYALGGLVPGEAHAPESAADVAALLRACDAAGRAAVLFGGGTLQALPNPPERYDIAIDLRGLDRALTYEPRDLTIAVEGGMTVAALDATLAAAGQFVPLDAPRAHAATVGGTLASGWAGPRRGTYGPPRDHVLGTTVALADGTLASAGGMVVKNSTGYDLSKVYVGSQGTLAAIVRANLKTRPLPAARRVAIASLPERTRERAAANLASLDAEPAAALVIRGFRDEIDGRTGIDGRIFVLFEGTERAVELATRELRSALGAAGVPETRLIDRDAPASLARVLDAYVATLGTRSATFRSFGTPDDAEERAACLARAARDNELDVETIEDACNGDVIARVSSGLAAEFAERLEAFEAQRVRALPAARVLAAAQPLRARLQGYGAPPPALAKMRDLKGRFDPNATLAPGRFVGGL